jgi:hypothetical protein
VAWDGIHDRIYKMHRMHMKYPIHPVHLVKKTTLGLIAGKRGGRTGFMTGYTG